MTTKASLFSAALLMLSGCDSQRNPTDLDMRLIAERAADNRVRTLEARITALEQDSAKLNAQINNVRELALAVDSAHESLRKTVNHNVDLENTAKLADMTARGACGSDWVTYPGGAQGWRYRQCTLKDMH